jgi:hypothetical protein
MDSKEHLQNLVITVYNIIERILSRVHYGIHVRLYQIKARKRMVGGYTTYFRLMTTYFRYTIILNYDGQYTNNKKIALLYYNGV